MSWCQVHELVPKAVRVAVLLNPADAASAETTLRQMQEAARPVGLQMLVFNAGTSREIEAAFAILAGERPDARPRLGHGRSMKWPRHCRSAFACRLAEPVGAATD
jgi:hypothetical protein